METIDIVVNGILHQASLHRSMDSRMNRTIVYYHGGGFIFGDKDDLPAYAIRRFTKAGFDLLCMEYPKAPEMNLDDILDFTEKQLYWFLDHCHRMNLSSEYIMFGRSAGGYIVLEMTKRMLSKHMKSAEHVIVFYGYESFESNEFINPSEYYLQYPILSWRDVRSSIESRNVFKSDLLKRYPLYIYARQSGNWLKLLGASKKSEDHDLREAVSDFPRIFFAASEYDKDVDYQNTKLMSKKYINSFVFTSSQPRHEFDQSVSAEAEQLYDQLLNWLNQ